MEVAVRIVLVSGSLRAGSGNSAVVRTAAAVAPEGVDGVVFDGMGDLPHFNPDDDHDPLPGPVAALRAAIGAGDAVMFCTPEYAGALPGSFKNLLDWTVGGAEMYRRPVAFINASGIAAPTGGADAHDSLRKVLGYVGAEIVEDACVRIPVPRDAVHADGLIADAPLRARIAAALAALAEYVRARPADDDLA
jgi:chromate reductase